MRRSRERDDEALRGLLRRGDPAGDGREPTPGELARMRREILSATEAPRTVNPWLAWSAAAARHQTTRAPAKRPRRRRNSPAKRSDELPCLSSGLRISKSSLPLDSLWNHDSRNLRPAKEAGCRGD